MRRPAGEPEVPPPPHAPSRPARHRSVDDPASAATDAPSGSARWARALTSLGRCGSGDAANGPPVPCDAPRLVPPRIVKEDSWRTVQGHGQRRHQGLGARLGAVRAAARRRTGAPSVVYIVLDDVGFSAMSCYGGPIETPNIDRIAAEGVRYTQWHTTALCSPTRSCLLTGRNHTRNSMACITEAAIGFPNASGTIPPENGMLSEILGELGWNTYMVGKWHLCPTDEMNLASTAPQLAERPGLRALVRLPRRRDEPVVSGSGLRQPPGRPADDSRRRATTSPMTSPTRRSSSSRTPRRSRPEKPFFLYYAPGACHAPHHAPKEWIDKFKGRFDMGYEAMREQTLARQKELGIVPADTELPPVNPIGTPETRTGPEGQPFPALDYTLPWDVARRRREAAVRPDGRGVRRVPRPRRPPHRPAARLPRGQRPARQHHHRRRLRQRRERRGRPERAR